VWPKDILLEVIITNTKLRMTDLESGKPRVVTFVGRVCAGCE